MRNFKQVRSDAGLTQEEIGRKLGVTVQTVYKWERGRAPVARRHWPILAALFGLSVDDMEAALVQTLLESCMERGSVNALKNAIVSGLYRPELLQDAFARFNVYHVPTTMSPVPPAVSSNARELELREEILRLREENVKLREEILRLKETLSASNPDGEKSSTSCRYPSNVRPSDKPETTMR